MRNTENYVKNRENPFEGMSPEAKYWIGYIFADGHLVYNNRAYSISLFSKDENIMLKFKNFIGDKAKMYKRPSGIYQVIYNSKPVTKWFMETFNIPQVKALTLNPNIELDWDIVHGYFDGDGSVRLNGTHYEAKFTTGSEIWANRLKNFLEKYEIESVITPKGKAFDVNIYKKSSVAILFAHLYTTNTSRLEYKYQRFVALFGNK